MRSSIAFLAVTTFIALITTASHAVNHDQMKPLPQPEPVTVSDKAVLKFKPQLKISEGCHSYPAVQADGGVTGGLEWSTFDLNGECKGPSLGSQIYARSTWHNNLWAIMYAWYFPKGRFAVNPLAFVRLGRRHNWEYAIVWIDNPALENSTILGVSLSAGSDKQAPPKPKYVDGTSLKVAYYYNDILGKTALELTKDSGETQDLIMWDQLPAPARDALSNTNWDPTWRQREFWNMPLSDARFGGYLDKGWRFRRKFLRYFVAWLE